MQRDKGGIVQIERQHLLGLAHDGLEIAFLVGVVDGNAAPLAMEQQLHAGKSALELSNAGDSSDGVEHIRAYALDVLPLRNGKDQPVGTGQGRLDCPQCGRPAGTNWSGDAGKQHNLSERKDGQGQSFSHSRYSLRSPTAGRNDSPTEIQATVCTDHARIGAKWVSEIWLVGTIKPIIRPHGSRGSIGGDSKPSCQEKPEGFTANLALRRPLRQMFPAAWASVPSKPCFPRPATVSVAARPWSIDIVCHARYCESTGPKARERMTDSGMKPLAARLAEALGNAYTIEGEIGRGGMGVVYRARDERLQRRVAIKVLPPELAFQQDIRERFTREAQTAAKLSHPHIVPIHSVGEGQGLVYFVMGYVEGESVAARIRRRGSLPVEEARRIMMETADALSAAHALSVIHRDIKPDNILLEGTRGRVMVTDFGIAKALSSTSGATLTGIGVAIGTPAFMSPEQAAGERDIDGRSDLYSLGVVTYQMLTGALPFNAPSVAGILMKQITEPAPDLRDQEARYPGGSGSGGRTLPGEGSGGPVGHCRCPETGAGEPQHGRSLGWEWNGAAEHRNRSSAGSGRCNGTSGPAPARPGHPRGRVPAPGLRPRCPPASRCRCPGETGRAGRTGPGSWYPIPASPRSFRKFGANSPAGQRSPRAAWESTSPPGSSSPGFCSPCSAWALDCCGAMPRSGRAGTAGATC